jgi:hypothetical protein
METRAGTGFIERGFYLLEDGSIQPNLMAFLRRYDQRLFRLDNITVLPPAAMDSFLLETPIDMLCSGAPDLHGWWRARESNRTNIV